MDKSKATHELDLIDYIQHFWKHKIAIIILAIICAVATFATTKFLVKDKYTANGVLYISSESSVGTQSGDMLYADIVTSRYLADTYMETLTLRSFLTDVSDATGNRCTWKEIEGMLSVSIINETEYISVSITSTDKQLSYDLANAICNKANAKFSETFKGGSATVIDKVILPENPDNKNTMRNTIIGAAVGVLIAVAFLSIQKFFDDKLHRSEELKVRYDLPILGETAQDFKNKKKRKKDVASESDQIRRVLSKSSDFDTVETYKSIRTNIMLSMPKKDEGSVILLTSASPNEGKTTTSVNVAITFAEMGAKTILLDCDLRKSRVHRYLQIKRENGVSNVICGYIELADAIKHDIRPNLDVLTAGDIPPNPSELLLTDQFIEIIQTLRKKYDYIILDTPPITVVTDAAIMSKYSDGVILVTREEATSHTLLSIAISELKKSNANIFGAVVHDCSEKRKKYYYSNRHIDRKINYHYGDDPAPVKGKS